MIFVGKRRFRATMSHQSLEEALQAAESPVEMLRNSQIGPYAFPGTAEFTNWMDEQRAWRETCVLFEQSFHMTDLYIEGPAALRLLSDFGVNNFETFEVNKAKQFVACNHDGYVIGDAILFYLDEDRFNLVGRPTAHNWVHYQAETRGYDVTLERDERLAANPAGRRKLFRYQVQGPNALELLEEVTGGPLPEIRFFNMTEFSIAGQATRALRHGMAGQPGYELFGPWEYADKVRDAIVEAGYAYGLRQVGSRTYATNTLESGWIPSPCPAIYDSAEMKGYREWLPASGYEGMASIGGSFYSEDISDYYLTPYDLGYGRFVDLNHEFVGREALAKMANDPRREKVTLVWNGEDVTRVIGSLFQDGDIAKHIDLPLSNYATLQYDRVSKDGGTVGISTYTGYSYNERAMLSLACIDVEHSEPGTEVTVVWGEEGGGTSKPTVERHVQTEIRATVAPAPIAEFARTAYRGSSAE
jgi:glycine cleavage system aminomethyltransferase T